MPASTKSAVSTTPGQDAPFSGLIALHRCRTIDWTPSPVVAIESCPDGSVVAVAREDGAIEFWDTEFWHCSSVIPGKRDACITSLVWTFDTLTAAWRLFSFGLDTNVVEWDLRLLQPRCVTSSLGGAVWDAAAQPSTSATDDAAVVAIATDDGAVRLLVAESQGLHYKRSFARAECRALSIAWSTDGSIVYAGYSDGCIRAHAVDTGVEVLRITAAPARAAGVDECIWSLAVLSDGAIVSGSSRGLTQIWEPQFGTLLSTFHQHQSDVLCVAAAPDGSRVFAAGVDPSITMFERQRARDADVARFQYSERKRPHTHDVRAMSVAATASGASFLVTGGNDAQLLVHSVEQFERRHPVRISRNPQAPVLRLSRAAKPPLLLACSRTRLDLWRFPSVDAPSTRVAHLGEEGDAMELSSEATHLARLSIPGATSCSASALAPDGSLLAVSTPWRTFLVRLDGTAAASTAGRGKKGDRAPPGVDLASLPDGVPAGLALCFSADSRRLFVGDGGGRIVAADVGGEEDADVLALHEFKDVVVPGATVSAGRQVRRAFTDLQASECGKWLLAVTVSGAHLLDVSANAYHGQLPIAPTDGPVTASCFSADGSSVAIATTDVKLAVFDCAKLAPAVWLGQRADVALKLDAVPGFVLGISYRPGAEDDLLLYSHGATCHISLSALRQGGSSSGLERKKRQRGSVKPVFVGDAPGAPVRVMPHDCVCLGAAFVSSSSALLVEANWNTVLKKLPAPLALRVYGH